MDYQHQLRKFIGSQYLYTGLRITAGVIIPAVVLYQLGLLVSMISIPLGALFVSSTDSPGPVQHRRNGMLISIVVNFLVVVITGYCRANPWLIGVEIVVFSLLFSLIGVYGNRANSIGLVALIVFTLNVDSRMGSSNILLQGLYYVTGGIWYASLSLILYTLKPYRLVQQLLGECLMEMANYLRTRSHFYDKDADVSVIFNNLMNEQVNVHHYQEQLREMLFTTRRLVAESTHKGRILMMIFRESIDLFERIMTAPQDYSILHKEFGDTPLLENIRHDINLIADILYDTGLAIQLGNAYRNQIKIEEQLSRTRESFDQLRREKMHAANIEAFIRARHILNSVQDLAERTKRLINYTSYDLHVPGQANADINLRKFATHKEINIDLIISNLSFKSVNFRHAVRLMVALLSGYIISLMFPLGHGYWILLTIVTIIRPAYSLSKKRNIQRLAGTFSGAVIGFLLLYTTRDNTIIFIVMVFSMILTYSTLMLNYGISIACLTIFLLLTLHFLDPHGLTAVLKDRVIDTMLGSVIAYLASYFVLPSWEHEQIDGFLKAALQANRNYFLAVSQTFEGRPANIQTFKINRKEAFVALANLSDNFQRMLSEPKSQQPHLQEYHQFVAANHMLTSHIASLSYYAEQFGTMNADADFSAMIKKIDLLFERALAIGEKSTVVQVPKEEEEFPVHHQLRELLEKRKKDLEKGVDTIPPELKKTLSNLTNITDQFRMISALIIDEMRILQEINS